MEKGFWHKDLGYWQTVTEPTQEVLESYPEGTKEVPIKPVDGCIYDGENWNPPSTEWLYNTTAIQVRITRDRKLLREVDPIVTNVLRWNELSEEKKTAWTQYRKQLLDITEQSGFPFEINWPEKP